MYADHTVGLVVTAYNEEGLVGEVIDTVPEFVDRVYVVDDGSNDGTWAEIRRHADRSNDLAEGPPPVTSTGVRLAPRVVTLQHRANGGVGAAMKTGYRRALADGVDVVASIDGDGQMPPGELHRLLEPVVQGRADYAKGNRLWNESARRGMSRWRLFGNSLLTLLTKTASGYWGMSDPQNGYSAISREALETIPLDRLTDDYGFLNDLLVTLNVFDVRIADVGHTAKYGDEQSHIKYSTFVPRLSGLLLRNFLWRLKTKYLVFDFHPLVLSYALGVVAVLASLAIGATALLSTGPVGPAVMGATSFLGLLLAGLLLIQGLAFDVERNADLVVRVHDVDVAGQPGVIPADHPAIADRGRPEDRPSRPVVSSDGGRQVSDSYGSDD